MKTWDVIKKILLIVVGLVVGYFVLKLLYILFIKLLAWSFVAIAFAVPLVILALIVYVIIYLVKKSKH